MIRARGQRTWNVKPPVGSRALTGHPLCPAVGILLNEGSGGANGTVNILSDTVSGRPLGRVGTDPGFLWTAGSIRGLSGPVLRWTSSAGGNSAYFPEPEMTLPLTQVTVLFGYEKTDATPRASTGFSADLAVGVTDRLNVHLPYNDGRVYWDFGGATEGTTRLSVASLTVGNDIWAFTVGPRGMEIWQNGQLRASNAATPTRTYGGTGLAIGGRAPDFASDLANVHFLLLYHQQLTVDAIQALTRDPYQWVAHPMPLSRFYGGIAAPVVLTGSGTIRLTASAGLTVIPGLTGSATVRLTGTAVLSGGIPPLVAAGTIRVTGTATLSGGTPAPFAGSGTVRITATALLGAITPGLAGSATIRLTASALALSAPTAQLAGRARIVITAAAALTTGASAATKPLRTQHIQRPFGRVERV